MLIVKFAFFLGFGFFMTKRMLPDFSLTNLEQKNLDIKINPWGLRPLNSIATLYTDFFRNTPLLVQFMFIHFGVQLGKHIQNMGIDITNDLLIIS